ncbi:hypothetical protein ACFL6C_01720 [Myxococcota bacterium]
MLFLLSLLVGTGNSGPADVAVVGLGEASLVERTVMAAANAHAKTGHQALNLPEMYETLTGIRDPREPNEDSLERMLADARDREARFDSTGALDLRAQILRAFHESARPTKRLRHIAAMAAHDTVAALLSEGRHQEALDAAQEAVRLFADAEVETTRHPPPVCELLARAREQLSVGPRGRLRLRSNGSGWLMVGGWKAGKIDKQLEVDLPVGTYRVWIADDDDHQLSLPHRVEITTHGADLFVDSQLEHLIQLRPVVAVACASACPAFLRALGQRLGVSRIIGVLPEAAEGPDGLEVDVSTGTVKEWQLPAEVVPQIVDQDVESLARFSPWYLAPFGVGQFAQDRPIFGSSYAVTQAGLLAWHLVAWHRHASAASDHDHAREPDLRWQRNLSAALFYTAIAVSIIEAVVVGLVSGE